MNESKKKNLLIIIAIAIASSLIVAFMYFNPTYNTVDSPIEFGGNVYESAQNEESAVVTAVTGLNFYKNKQTQSVNFCNNARNNYVEKTTIYLADGSVVYSSDYLKPGDTINNIEVYELDEAGVYSGIIVYSFYTNNSAHSFVSRLETPVEIRYIN